MDIQEKAKAIVKAQAGYTDINGRTFEQMVDSGEDCSVNQALDKIYREVLGMDVKTAVDQPWHDDLIDTMNELQNA